MRYLFAAAVVMANIMSAALAEDGVASWYGFEHAGKRTANGERFNPMKFTAAHPTLPFGSYVCVVYPATGKSVVVRINDRGPFVKGRTIDLSLAAANALGMKRRGVANVEVSSL